MELFNAAIWRDSVSLIRFHIYSYVEVILCEILRFPRLLLEIFVQLFFFPVSYFLLLLWFYVVSAVIHCFTLKQEPQPQCLTCQTTCTVKHILIESRTFAVIRKRFFKVNNLTDLFAKVKIDDILSFLRETELYQKIWQLKLVNLVQTNEILLIEHSTYLNIHFEIFGWICMYI